MQSVKEYFEAIGAEFSLPAEQFLLRLPQIKAFIFDWDGVFNDGSKNENMTSLFAEPDSMGTNLLRFGYWLESGTMPPFAVMSGENNAASHKFALRERINALYFKIPSKTEAFLDFCHQNGIKPDEVAFIFDDVIDLSVAKLCGLRFLVRRKASPLMTHFAKENDLCDYVTACQGGEHAVREICELMMGFKGLFDKVLHERMMYGDVYKEYVRVKNQQHTVFYTWRDDKIVSS
jgi:3-deoxy-D-manno-octulosonate 8-phosphate phosphatase (KDO 8-P phosphatase)